MITSGYERSAPDTPHPPTPAAQLQPAAISGTSSRIGAVPVPANGHTTSPHKRCAQAPTPINFDHPHYNAHRPHRSLGQSPPAGGTPPRSDATVRPLRRDRLGGLIHEYVQVA